MDKTWIYRYNRQLAEWTAASESCPKRPKTQMLAGKVLESVFWDEHGILSIDYIKREGIQQ